MGSIKELAIIFCAACVISGGFRLLTGGVMEKSATYIFSLIVLASIVGAISGLDIDFNINVSQNAELQSGAEAEISEYQAEYICRKILTEKDIIYEKVTAEANKSQDGSIVINKITIKGADKGDEAVEAVVESGLTETVVLE